MSFKQKLHDFGKKETIYTGKRVNVLIKQIISHLNKCTRVKDFLQMKKMCS